jgi:hypothetical protein
MWRDDRMQAAVDTTTGFIVARLAERLKRPVYEMERLFLASKAYAQLCDSETGLYADSVWETADRFLREAASALFPEDVLRPKSFFKYRSLSDPHTKEIFENKELWYSSPAKINDPFDCRIPVNFGAADKGDIDAYCADWECAGLEAGGSRPEIEKQIERQREDIEAGRGDQLFAEKHERFRRDLFDNHASMFCFSMCGDSILMFSHYAEAHRGICMEFSFSLMDAPTGVTPAQSCLGGQGGARLDVDYRDVPPNLNYFKIRRSPLAFFAGQIGTKAKCWEYEKEHRLFRLEREGAVGFAPHIFKRVILGALTDNDDYVRVKA